MVPSSNCLPVLHSHLRPPSLKSICHSSAILINIPFFSQIYEMYYVLYCRINMNTIADHLNHTFRIISSRIVTTPGARCPIIHCIKDVGHMMSTALHGRSCTVIISICMTYGDHYIILQPGINVSAPSIFGATVTTSVSCRRMLSGT